MSVLVNFSRCDGAVQYDFKEYARYVSDIIDLSNFYKNILKITEFNSL